MIRGRDVTVIIPTIPGREELLARAVRSVDAQTVAPREILIHADTERRGAYYARNTLVDMVETDWFCALDDDDEFLPNHIKVLVRGANKSKADLIYSYPEFVGGRDPLACLNDAGVLVPEPINIPFGPMQEYSLRTLGNFIPSTIMVKTDLVRRIGGYPAPYSMSNVQGETGKCEDALLLVKLLDAGARFYHVCGVRSWKYHLWDGNLGGRGLDRMHEFDDPTTVHQRPVR